MQLRVLAEAHVITEGRFWGEEAAGVSSGLGGKERWSSPQLVTPVLRQLGAERVSGSLHHHGGAPILPAGSQVPPSIRSQSSVQGPHEHPPLLRWEPVPQPFRIRGKVKPGPRLQNRSELANPQQTPSGGPLRGCEKPPQLPRSSPQGSRVPAFLSMCPVAQGLLRAIPVPSQSPAFA